MFLISWFMNKSPRNWVCSLSPAYTKTTSWPLFSLLTGDQVLTPPLPQLHTVDGSEIPRPTTVWMVIKPVVNNATNYQPTGDRRISCRNSISANFHSIVSSYDFWYLDKESTEWSALRQRRFRKIPDTEILHHLGCIKPFRYTPVKWHSHGEKHHVDGIY